ncbi:NfeD family protein [Cellulomonas triticagri]|uniref:NfeD family protein n=2 Tax=Cellulomonas triticagri TaxID=2483352 RepID=A0A3M2JIP3_9CELL|nr:NfeD family protein [Cellulomonas triticagri]RMI13652.1 NfeD family protein [Cellulomonas triticagri]
MGWLWWLGGALLLGVVEIFALDLIFLMLAGGALVGALANALGAPLAVQIVAAAVASLLMLFALRPFLLRRLRLRTSLVETNTAALVGRSAVVVAPTDLEGGRVKLAGEVWSARAVGGAAFAAGTEVRVARIDGATAVVEPVGPAGATGPSGAATDTAPGGPAAAPGAPGAPAGA